MMVSISLMVSLVALVASGCAWHGSGSRDLHQNRDFLLTITWVGVQTRPPCEVVFTTQRVDRNIASWVAAAPGFRKAEIISKEEALRLQDLLSQATFSSRRISAGPDFHVQQYIVSMQIHAETSVFALGLDETTVYLLMQIQGALADKPAATMQPLVDNLRGTQKAR
jgi:hypothetical protein